MSPVAIAGGGIGGLACALALARRGFPSLVLEQAPEFGEAGVGLQMAPNALSVLDALGAGAVRTVWKALAILSRESQAMLDEEIRGPRARQQRARSNT